MHRAGFALSEDSHMRTTIHPFARSRLSTFWSRIWLRAIFASQYFRFVEGGRKWRGFPCQKSPSTKSATFGARKAKSGLTVERSQPLASIAGSIIRKCRRHPCMPALRSAAFIATSVEAFPRERIAAMIRERSGVVGHSEPNAFICFWSVCLERCLCTLRVPFQGCRNNPFNELLRLRNPILPAHDAKRFRVLRFDPEGNRLAGDSACWSSCARASAAPAAHKCLMLHGLKRNLILKTSKRLINGFQ